MAASLLEQVARAKGMRLASAEVRCVSTCYVSILGRVLIPDLTVVDRHASKTMVPTSLDVPVKLPIQNTGFCFETG